MRSAARAALAAAFAEARRALRAGDAQAALLSLERVHILGQRLPLAHAGAHWLMLCAGWQARDWREVLGQVPRIVAALLFSRLWVPVGNSGRARVSAFQPMPLPEELRRLLE